MLKVVTRPYPTARAKTLLCNLFSTSTKTATSTLLEEERLPWYRPDQFYPVHIGETLASRYKVVGKLGYGAHSTSWLCQDTRNSGYVTVKVCTHGTDKTPSLHRELKFYEHVSSRQSQHPGQVFIRGLWETFEVKGPCGQHLCLVHPTMHMSIRELQYINKSHRLNATLLKWTYRNLLSALSFLHDDAGVVHADVNASNIMFTLDDASILDDFAKAEDAEPSPAKVVDDVYTIYGSRTLRLPKDALWGQPVLCDFGEARIGPSHRGLIQPELYRAPEVLFNMEWNCQADIWSAAVMIWDLFENKHLFKALDEDGQSSATHHVAEMVAFLGLPPPDFIQRSEVTNNVFDEKGQWKGAGNIQIPPGSLEETISAVDGEDKERFLDFVRSMLKWEPEKRKRASELLKDPWMSDAIP